MIEPDARGTGGTLRTRAAAAPVWRYLLGGVVAAVAAVATNLAWRGAYAASSGQPLPDAVSEPAVTVATASAVLLAAAVYLLLSRALTIATPLYMLGCVLAAGVSCIAPFAPFMPDGAPPPPDFPQLAVPMHVAAGLLAASIVPLVVLFGVKKPRQAGADDQY